MTISYQWLLEYLPVPVPVDELSHILTSIGLEVEAIEAVESVRGGLAGLLTGQVMTCAKHPNADKLSVTTVNVGGDTPLNIVCGAPNVAAGQKVVVATVGTTVHPTHGEAFLIKKAKIRGADSEGMICAEDEIGLGESHAGIMILPEDTPIGMLASEYFKIPSTDHAIHIGLTPNRSDANSHLGVARDVCAYFNHHKGTSYEPVLPDQPDVAHLPISNISITISEPDACPRYTGISLSGVKVAESPEWLKNRLQCIGLRSINNIVDITNYVLHEFGQPLHSFDADQIGGQQINVGFMPDGTAFVTLDEKERKLSANDLMICDGNGPIAIGGVFGGLHSGITNTTTNVFIESAYFTPAFIRRTSLHHSLRTDAATHFEKGVDMGMVLPALLRAASMMVEVAGATITSCVEDIYQNLLQSPTIKVTYAYIKKLSGKDYSALTIKNILVSLGFAIVTETETHLVVLSPTSKTDITIPADIVEEILRIDGLDNVALSGRLEVALTSPQKSDRKERERLASLLCGAGLQEVMTNSIVNSKYYPDNTTLVRMINSLSTELDVMRPSMLESGLEVVAYNCNRKCNDLALFEFGNTYMDAGGKYIETPRLAIWVTGNMRPASWDAKPEKASIYYLKGLVGNLMLHCGITGATETSSDDGNGVVYKLRGQVLATIDQMTAAKLKEFDIKQDLWFANIHWDQWVKAINNVKVKYQEVGKYPSVTRDLALVLSRNVNFRQVQEVTEQLKLTALRNYRLFDVFESDKLGAGKKSFAINYTFMLQDRTLTDAETEELMQQLVTAYKTKLEAQIRG